MLFDLTWKNCNYIAHSSNVQDMARKISQIADEHWTNQRHKLLVNSSLSITAWTRSKDGWIKINIDARFKDGIAITAVIIINKNGSILFARTNQHHCMDSLAAETMGIKEARQFISKAKLENMIFESGYLAANKFSQYP